MSYDLIVEHEGLPPNIAPRWAAVLGREGFVVEIMPGFSPATHPGGFLPMRVTAAPPELFGYEMSGEEVSGFEVTFEDDQTSFRFGARGPVQELSLMCVAAALLAELTGGLYVDPQTGQEARAPDALELAITTAQDYLGNAESEQLRRHPFPGWAALGVR